MTTDPQDNPPSINTPSAAVRQERRLFYMSQILFTLLIALSAAMTAWAVGLALFMALIVPRDSDIPPQSATADIAIVLTGDAGRIETGVKLLQAERIDRLFISGVHKDVTPETLPQAPNLPADLRRKVELGHAALSTKGNVEETAKWLKNTGAKKIFLVTSDYHLPRARLEFARAIGDGVEIVNYPVISHNLPRKPSEASNRRLLVREYNKFIVSIILRYV